VRQHERKSRQPSQLHLVAVSSKHDVVAEPLRHLRRVGDAAHPSEDSDVVDGRSLFVGQIDPLAQTSSDPPRPQNMLHRLAQTKVNRQ
jgi:hypothetical protein